MSGNDGKLPNLAREIDAIGIPRTPTQGDAEMSATIPSTAPVTTQTAIAAASGKATLIANMAVVAKTDAQAVPALVTELAALDPTLVAPVQAKALVASKTPIGVVVAYALSWGVAKYGLGWDADTTSLVAGLVVLIASYGMRYITNAPISGFFKAKV
jgi:hypothetical protein